jgi:hypothetical protein
MRSSYCAVFGTRWVQVRPHSSRFARTWQVSYGIVWYHTNGPIQIESR